MLKQMMIGMIFLLLVIFNRSPSAQDMITFERIPGVGVPQDGMEISTQFRDTVGVTFMLEGGGFPQIAQVGAPATAFRGPPDNTTPDTPAPGQDVGMFFLTDNGRAAGEEDVVDRANQLDNTPVCTIGLGSGVGIPPLQDIARETGCTFAQADDASALDRVFEQMTRGLLEGRVVVSGVGRFDPPLDVGLYTISGVLKTMLDRVNVDTPFHFPVEVSRVPASMTRKLEQGPVVPYTAEEEAAGLF